MNTIEQKKISKFLSLILRHSPETIKLSLDRNGWANIDELLTKAAAHGKRFNLRELENIVATNDKQRFSFNSTKTKIRANQGHSINIDLELVAKEPPEFLFHGTAEKNVSSIMKEGIQKKNRQYVHLSIDKQTAIKVGNRHGKPKVLVVLAGKMHREGLEFFLARNGVWLTDFVPTKYISMPVS